MELPSIKLEFEKPVYGYWDGGAKKGGVFTPSCYAENNPDKSYVRWNCYELNHWFKQLLHRERGENKGKPFTNKEVIRRAKAYLRKVSRVPVTVSIAQ